MTVEFTKKECVMVVVALAGYAAAKSKLRHEATQAALKTGIDPAQFEKILKEYVNYGNELIAPGEVDWGDDKGHAV